MAGLRIAAAQSASVPGDIAANVRRHCVFIDAAAAANVKLLVFPELSLSGYEPGLLAAAALSVNDPRLDPIQQRATASGMTIVAGAPIANPAGLPWIGAIVFQPGAAARLYRKHFLYPGEENFAAAGAAISHVINVQGIPVALAIGNDTVELRHPHAAAMAGTQLYVSCAVLTVDGHKAETVRLAGYAKLFHLGILLSNHAFDTGGYRCAGGSAAWLPDGQLLVNAPGQGERLLLADEDGGDIVAVDTSSFH